MSYIKHRADESLEDYLETILLLQKRLGQVRSIDIANEMNFSKPSVSVAMKNLRANNVLERHTILSNWLIKIGVSEEVAKQDACRVEHDLSEESFEAIKKMTCTS